MAARRRAPRVVAARGPDPRDEKIVYVDGAMPGLKVGSRVEYLGDMANPPRVGTVTAVEETRWGHTFDMVCDLEPGETEPYIMKGLGHGAFGGLSPRFLLLHPIEVRHVAQRALDKLCATWSCSPEEAVRRAIHLAAATACP